MIPSGARQHLDLLAMGILMACCVAWGVNQVAIQISNTGITPILGAGLRSLVATLFLMTWCRIQGVRLFNRYPRHYRQKDQSPHAYCRAGRRCQGLVLQRVGAVNRAPPSGSIFYEPFTVPRLTPRTVTL